MRAKRIALSLPRRFMIDFLRLSARIPSVPVQRQMNLCKLVAARNRLSERPCWPAIFLKAIANVSDRFPPLRRAFLELFRPHYREYPITVLSLAVEREFQGEPAVFFGQISDGADLPLTEFHSRVRHFAEAPIESIPKFQKLLSVARLPRFLRRLGLWLALNLPRTRPGQFGTVGLSVYSSLGAESLHPLSPLTATFNYGVIDEAGWVTVRIIYDHRVFDGATAARALAMLEETLTGMILTELRAMANSKRLAA